MKKRFLSKQKTKAPSRDRNDFFIWITQPPSPQITRSTALTKKTEIRGLKKIQTTRLFFDARILWYSTSYPKATTTPVCLFSREMIVPYARKDRLATRKQANTTKHQNITCSPMTCLFLRHTLRSSPLDSTPRRLERISASSTPVSAPVMTPCDAVRCGSIGPDPNKHGANEQTKITTLNILSPKTQAKKCGR